MQSQPTYTVSGNVVKTIADAQFLVWIAMARGDDKMGAEAMRVLNFLTDRAASRTDAPRQRREELVMQITVRYVVMQDGEMFAECATSGEANRAFEQAAQPGREVNVVEVEPYEVEYE